MFCYTLCIFRVLQWIMENENMNRGTSSAYTDSDKTSSTHKRSHKGSALTPAPQQQYKQGYIQLILKTILLNHYVTQK